jgi:hypothetical protein
MNATHAHYLRSPRPRHRQTADDVTLIALHNAIRFSGLFAKYTAQRLGVRHLSHAAEQVAIELVARAVETTGNPAPHLRYTELGDLHTIRIRVSAHGNGLLIEVWDSDSAPPTYRDSHLSTVEQICRQWDCYQPDTGGKVIRAELEIPPPRQAPSDPLPQRTARAFTYPEPDQPMTVLHDPQVLQKVHDGLHTLDPNTVPP